MGAKKVHNYKRASPLFYTAPLVYLFACFYDVTGFSLIGELIFIVCFPWPLTWQMKIWLKKKKKKNAADVSLYTYVAFKNILYISGKSEWLSKIECICYLLKQWAAVRTHRGAMRTPPHCWTDCPISKRATCQGHCPGHCLDALPSGWLGGVGCFRVPHPGD